MPVVIGFWLVDCDTKDDWVDCALVTSEYRELNLTIDVYFDSLDWLGFLTGQRAKPGPFISSLKMGDIVFDLSDVPLIF